MIRGGMRTFAVFLASSASFLCFACIIYDLDYYVLLYKRSIYIVFTSIQSIKFISLYMRIRASTICRQNTGCG